MIVQGPSPVIVAPPQTQVSVSMVVFDLNAGTWAFGYGSGHPPKQVTGTIPPALLNALESRVQAAIEANEGWTPGSSTVVTP